MGIDAKRDRPFPSQLYTNNITNEAPVAGSKFTEVILSGMISPAGA
jgi:hypothetical protein